MEQKTEASQAVDERADMIAALSMCAAALAPGSSKRSRYIACEYACEALRRAALKAQPAPAEAELARQAGELHDYHMSGKTPDDLADNLYRAGFNDCRNGKEYDPVSSPAWGDVKSAIEVSTDAASDRVPMPKNADQAELMKKLGLAWLQTNSPERLIGAGRAAQDEDSARLEFGEITSVVHNDRGTQHTLMVYFKTKAGRDDFRDVFGAMALKDRARASAETGGVKS